MKDAKANGLSASRFVFLMIIAVIFWAFAFPFIKIGLSKLSFVNLTILRFLIVDLVFLIIILIQPKRFSKLYKKDVIPIFILGFLGVMVYHLGLNYGEMFVSPGAASLIIATTPIFILVSAIIFLKEKISSRKFIGVLFALLGLIIITVWGTENASIQIDYIFGALMVLVAAIMSTFYTIFGKKLLDRYNALSLTVYAIILGSLGLIPFLNMSLFSEVASLSFDVLFAVMFLGICSTVVGYTIWYVALEHKTASEVGVYLYAIPILSTLFSYFLLGEMITFLFIVGSFFIIAGLILVNYKRKIE